MPPQVVSSTEAPEDITCDALLVGAGKSAGGEGVQLSERGAVIDRALDGHLGRHLQEIGFKGAVGDVTVFPTLGRVTPKSVAVVGLGGDQDNSSLRRAAGVVARRLAERSVVASALHEPGVGEAAAAVAEGFLLGSYRFTTYKSDPRPSKIQRLIVLEEGIERPLEAAVARAEATMLARDLTNEPPSALVPETLEARAREIADVNGLECTTRDEDDLVAGGFGGISGVGQGSAQPPRLIELRYAPEGAAEKVVLIGKGITFDSGGLSLKPATSMEQMKTDMAGAAAVLGALSVCKRLDMGMEVVALIAAAENLPSATSIKPGDVLRHYGGKTSEIINTDAEGRLVLADALAYASEQKPDAMVDVATLTGAIKVALGPKATGMFSNDDALAGELSAAAQAAGERLWRLPLYDEYRRELDSEVADLKNTGGRWGGSILAALFLREFVGNGIPWAHLDIAGAARADSAYEDVTKGGTGVATRTLISFLQGRGARRGP
jgi:leucyl aminopeptidase